MFKCLFDDVTEVTAFSAVTVPVFSLVMLVFHGTVKPVFSFLDLVTNLGKIGEFERGTVFVNQVFEGNTVKT